MAVRHRFLTSSQVPSWIGEGDIAIPSRPQGLVSMTGLTLWLRADAITGKANNDTLTAWVDDSPAGNDATANGSPVYLTGQVNGLPAVQFNGSSQWLTAAGSTSASKQTTFVVVRMASLSGTQALVAGSAANSCLEFRIASGYPELLNQNSASLLTGSNILTVDTWTLVSATYNEDTDAISVRKNGTANTGTYTGALSGTSTVLVGKQGGGSPEYLNARIAEVLRYERALTSAELGNVEAYLTAKYAIS